MHYSKYKKIILYVLAILVSFLFLAPFLWLLFTSIKPRAEIYSYPLTLIPHKITFSHYIHVITELTGFATYFKNSVVVTIISVLAVTFLSVMGGYALGRLKFQGKGFFMFFILLVISVPYAVYLIPIYLIENNLGLINTNLGLILPYIALNLPLALFIMRGTFRTIPGELEEAAIIDGCNPWQLWYKVMVPIAKPGIATTVIFTFIMVWQEFVFAVTLMSDADYQTLPVGIVHLRDEAQSWAYGTLSTTIILALIPIFIVFVLMKNFFIKGLTEGAVKG